ncbi:hypothetical protein ACGFNU_17810 [Spirillospora sp. NPDC048911]|uniref:hypothetical protein n=1 Tax=Spirillospora sp. NPDC048911 TaxID=3364527 RepID=UPI00371B51D2
MDNPGGEAVGKRQSPGRQRYRAFLLVVVLLVIGAVASDVVSWGEREYRALATNPPRELEQSTDTAAPTRLGSVDAVLPPSVRTNRSRSLQDLTSRDVFSESVRTVTYSGLSLFLIGAREDKPCVGAVWGEALVGALSTAGCTQLVRGLYHGSNGQLGQIAILRMRDEHAAKSVVSGLSVGGAAGFIKPLKNAQGEAQLGNASSFGFSYQAGRDVVFSWAQSSAEGDWSKIVLALDEVLAEHID